MNKAKLEHVNITVSDPHRSAALMRDLFGWHIRWEGPSMSAGHTIHVGTDDQYIALYSNDDIPTGIQYRKGQPMNHIAMTVDDLEAVHAKVKAAGLKSDEIDAYEPGRRFYFYDWNGIEFEVVSYT